MMSQRLQPFISFLWVSFILCVLGWGGLYFVIDRMEPEPGARWLFFFLLTLAFSGIALPVIYFLNRRFPTTPPVDNSVVVREAVWVGVFVSLLAWLQLGRVLNSGLAVMLAAGLMLVEVLLRLGERSAWQPSQPPETAEGEADPDDDPDDEEEDEYA